LNKKILFIGHYAGLTGAPIILLRLLKWMNENTKLELSVLLKQDGPLKAAYEKIAPVAVYPQITSQKSTTSKSRFKLLTSLLTAKDKGKSKIIEQYPINSIDLIFANTITNGHILSSLSYLNCPVICRVAELNYWIHKSGKNNFELIKNHVSHFIAVSNAVKQNLTVNHGIPEKKIDVVHGFIAPTINFNTGKIRRSLNIPRDGIIVGGCGAEVWRKGKDLFIQLAISIFKKSKNTPIYFIWLGGEQSGEDFYQLQHDIKQAKLSDKMFLIPESPNPYDYFADFDIFAMVSREDPYPVVNLELAALGKPIICFEDSGGSPEFVENDSGFIVPYLDIDAFSEKVILLAKDKNLREKLGKSAREKVYKRHSILVTGPKLLEIINRFL